MKKILQERDRRISASHNSYIRKVGPPHSRSKKRKNAAISYFNRRVIFSPVDLSLSSKELHTSTMEFICAIESESKLHRVFVDFQYVTDISAAALVLLAGHLDRLVSKRPSGQIVIGSKTSTSKAGLFLEESGLSYVVNRSSGPSDDGVICGSGSVHRFLDEIMGRVSLEGFHDEMTAEQELLCYAAISEALLNVHYHAYKYASDDDKINKPWWLYTKVSFGKLHLALYDRGAGIPETLPRRPFFDRLKQLVELNIHSDASLISGAMEASRTSTGMEKHGKGSVNIKALVDSDASCHLLIYSNRGLYQHKLGEQDILADVPRSVMGTLLQWVIPIRPVLGGKDEKRD